MARDFLEAVGVTDVGNVRQFNEDSIVVAPDIGVMLLADGMGGHRAGEVASQLAANLVHTGIRTRLAEVRSALHEHSLRFVVNESINQANRAICDTARARLEHHGMGTTLAVAVFHDHGAVLGHVGDSRIYRLREGKLQLMTRDDSLLRQQVDAGLIAAVDAGESHNRALVTQALGASEQVDAHLRDVDAAAGDVFLLCSDGLTDLVDDADIELIVHSLASNLPLAAQVLVQTAKDNGGYDNVSVILTRIRAPWSARRRIGWLTRLAAWLR